MVYNFLFWNLEGNQSNNRANRVKNISGSLTTLAAGKQIDVFVFCECKISDDEVVTALNLAGVGTYRRSTNKTQKIKFFARLDQSVDRSVYADLATNRLAIQHLRIGRPPGILLAGLHFHYRGAVHTDIGRLEEMMPYSRTIKKIEKRIGNSRTVLVGDFNMNPYEGAMTAPSGLHAVMSRQLATALPRTIARRGETIFFNPTWSGFGDYTNSAAGSYYYDTLDKADHRWHLYDQVLLRPELMNDLEALVILSHDGVTPLVTKSGRPRKHAFSDHLPIFFSLTL